MQSSGNSSPETGPLRPSPSPSTPTRKRFALTGRSHDFDSRIVAARGDLADLRLAERLFAPHYAAAVVRTVTTRTPLTASVGGQPLSEVLAGEDFEVLELTQGHAWGVSTVDGAVGFVAADSLGPAQVATHVVLGSVDGAYPTGTRLTVDGTACANAPAVKPLDAPVGDYVTLAESLVGTPGQPGGRSGAGVDSAGLVFLALSLAGVRAPRFADLQAASLGHAVAEDAPMLRGDLLFFADHVAIAADADTAIHLDAAGERVVREPIASILDGAFGPLTVRRRLP